MNVLQAEARLARLKKDMGLVKGQGEEEEMKDYMKQASQGLILTSASIHGGAIGTNTSLKRGGSSGSMNLTRTNSDRTFKRQLRWGGAAKQRPTD